MWSLIYVVVYIVWLFNLFLYSYVSTYQWCIIGLMYVIVYLHMYVFISVFIRYLAS